jgi:hypothetical protein
VATETEELRNAPVTTAAGTAIEVAANSGYRRDLFFRDARLPHGLALLHGSRPEPRTMLCRGLRCLGSESSEFSAAHARTVVVRALRCADNETTN